MTNKSMERKLRFALRKAGYTLHKSRAMNWTLHNQLGYMIVDARINICVGGSNYDFSLEDVVAFVMDRCNS